MPVSPYPILATDPNEMLTQMQSLMDDLYQNRIGGANVGDVFQIGADDVLQLKYLSIGGLQKINGSLSVKPNNDLGLDSAADGLYVKLKADNGLAVDANGLYVVLKSGGGLSVDSTGLSLSAATTHNILSTVHTDAVGAASVVAGDLLFGNATPKWDRLAKGTAYQVVGMNSGATLPEWQASTRSTLSATGDMVYASSANVLARLIKGAEGTLLRAGATIPAYSTLTIPTTIAAGSVFVANSANTLSAVTNLTGTRTLTNTAGVVSWVQPFGYQWTDNKSLTGETSAERIIYLGGGKYVCGTEGTGKIFISSDYGGTWTDCGQLGAETTVFALAYVGSGVVLAGTYPNAKVYRSTDYGATWGVTTFADASLIDPYAACTAVRSLVSLGSNVVLAGTANASAVGDAGHILRSTDGGVNWTRVYDGVADQYGICAMVDLGSGDVLAGASRYAAGGGPFECYLYTSADSGANWTSAKIITSDAHTILTMVHLGSGIVLLGTGGGTNGGKIYKSTDSGANWTDKGRPISTETILNGLAYYSTEDIVVVGTNPTAKIAKSINQGDTWIDLGQPTTSTDTIYTIAFDENNVTVAGAYKNGGTGKILRSPSPFTGFGGGGTSGVAGTDTQIQYNKAGVFGADTHLTWTEGTDTLAATNIVATTYSFASAADTKIMFVDGSSFAGATGLTWTKGTTLLTVPRLVMNEATGAGSTPYFNLLAGTVGSPLGANDHPNQITAYHSTAGSSSGLLISTYADLIDTGSGLMIQNYGVSDAMTIVQQATGYGACGLGILQNHTTDTAGQWHLSLDYLHGVALNIKARGTGSAIAIMQTDNVAGTYKQGSHIYINENFSVSNLGHKMALRFDGYASANDADKIIQINKGATETFYIGQNGAVVMPNAVPLYMKDSGGTQRDVLRLAADAAPGTLAVGTGCGHLALYIEGVSKSITVDVNGFVKAA